MSGLVNLFIEEEGGPIVFAERLDVEEEEIIPEKVGELVRNCPWNHIPDPTNSYENFAPPGANAYEEPDEPLCSDRERLVDVQFYRISEDLYSRAIAHWERTHR